MVTNGVWMGTGGWEDTGGQENERYGGARRDTERRECVCAGHWWSEENSRCGWQKKNLTKRGGQGWLSVGGQASKAGKWGRQARQTSGANKWDRQASEAGKWGREVRQASEAGKRGREVSEAGRWDRQVRQAGRTREWENENEHTHLWAWSRERSVQKREREN